jgi:hypothetical protein
MISGFPPGLSGSPYPLDVFWKQNGFGHPGNWREDVVEFCISTYLNVALSIQHAPSIPYAQEFSGLYKYKVTAKVDQVEVWEDLADEEEHLSHVGSNNERPFRTHKRYLSKGTSVFVPALSQPLVSDDQSPSGEPIKRVRVSKDEIGSMYGLATGFPGRAEFVDLDKVESRACRRSGLSRWPSRSPRYRGRKNLCRSGCKDR